MKTNFTYYLILIITLLAGCDYVENPVISAGATNCISTDSFPAPAATQRNVLLEDFTGHKCPNCPGAAYNARQYQATLAGQGKNLIIVSIHPNTSLAVPEPSGTGSFETDFRTSEGTTYYTYYGMTYVPMGLVDRVSYNGSPAIDAIDWNTVIDNEFLKPLEIDLQMKAHVDTVNRLADVYVMSEFLTSKNGTYNLVVYVVEDSIIDWQVNGTNGDPSYPLNTNLNNYAHRHVLRDAVTPEWGSTVVSGSVATGEKFTNCFTDFVLPAAWNLEHTYFVAYIYDNSNKEILQVIEKHPSY